MYVARYSIHTSNETDNAPANNQTKNLVTMHSGWVRFHSGSIKYPLSMLHCSQATLSIPAFEEVVLDLDKQRH